MLTTTDDQREIQRCYDLGCNVYITKPVNYEGFVIAIRQLGLFFSVIKVPETHDRRPHAPSSTSTTMPGSRRWFRRTWQRAGYAVDLQQDGTGGLARLAAGGIDAVALDHYMPGQDGLETLAAIQALPDPPPVIYVTGSRGPRRRRGPEGRRSRLRGQGRAGRVSSPCWPPRSSRRSRPSGCARLNEAAQAEVRAAATARGPGGRAWSSCARSITGSATACRSSPRCCTCKPPPLNTAEVKTELQAANKRVMAVAQVHRRLYTSDDVQLVALDQYLDALAEDLRQSADGGDAASLSLDAKSVEVDPTAPSPSA